MIENYAKLFFVSLPLDQSNPIIALEAKLEKRDGRES
jgi:hypothetical protein